MNTYQVGSLVTLSAAFDVAGVATNPTATTFRIREPSGTVTTYLYGSDNELVRDSAGRFHVDWSATEAGEHRVHWQGTGAAQGAAFGAFMVEEAPF